MDISVTTADVEVDMYTDPCPICDTTAHKYVPHTLDDCLLALSARVKALEQKS